MSAIDECMTRWQSFRERWPIGMLESLTLEQYSHPSDSACLSGWVKYRTDGLGWRPNGGTRYDRIGVCALPEKSGTRQQVIASYSDRKICRVDAQRGYLWRVELGNDLDSAFRATKQRIVQLASAAQCGDTSVLFKSLIDPDYEWKVFFLYQDPERPTLLPVQDKDQLFTWYLQRGGELPVRGRNNPETAVLANQRLMAQRLDRPLFAYVDRLIAESRDPGLYEPDPLEDDQPPPKPATPSMPALNQILYGPPGTGKTYATVHAALEILAPDFLKQHRTDRAALKALFDRLVRDHRICLVTFHQSFSYEDFVEGLRATTNKDTGELRYEVVDGVFKSLCDAAAARVTSQQDAMAATPIDVAKRQIWKMSLGNTLGSDAGIYDECIEDGYALLGYGGAVDFTGCQSRDDVLRRFAKNGLQVGNEQNDYAVTSVTNFVTHMKPGDLLIVSDGNEKFRAIGEVNGDYEFRPHTDYPSRYAQMRRVTWLRIYKPSQPYGELMNNKFSQMTLYRLRSPSIDLDKLQGLLKARHSILSPLGSQQIGTSNSSDTRGSPLALPDTRVLIIDEINRGNISRIFGELITLIEPSKRAGASEALQVVLPYSKTAFSVPGNVYLIGTMNTADRSLTGLDVALRRRFEFREMPPRPDLLEGVDVEGVAVAPLLRVINQRIEALLDRDHCLGHAYFMPLHQMPTLEQLAKIFANQVLPLLQEYFFDDWQRIRWVLNDHRKPMPFQFVRDQGVDVDELFGADVNIARNPKAWTINQEAFRFVESYLGVIDHREAQEDP